MCSPRNPGVDAVLLFVTANANLAAARAALDDNVEIPFAAI